MELLSRVKHLCPNNVEVNILQTLLNKRQQNAEQLFTCLTTDTMLKIKRCKWPPVGTALL